MGSTQASSPACVAKTNSLQLSPLPQVFSETVLPEKVKNLLTLFYPPLHRMMINTDDLFC
jgi:hypothetical protein